MPHLFSLYLDLISFIAALAVFFGHLVKFPFTENVFWPPVGAYGVIAVTIFFVLSGYVIAYVTHTREKSFASYASARISRIYSVVLIALLVTLLFDNIGLALNPDFYSNQTVMRKPQSIEGYISALFFVSEYQVFNFNGIAPGSNGPYWSMSFEVTYYVIAGLVLFTRRMISIPCTVFILAVGGQTIAALLPLWLIGYCLYFMSIDGLNRKLLYAGYLVSMMLVIATPAFAYFLPRDNFGFEFPWGRGPFNRNLIQDYLAAIFFSLHLFCAREIFKNLEPGFKGNLESSIRWLGSLTFPLYLIHFPALALFASISPWSRTSLVNALFISILTFIIVIISTTLSDKLKHTIKSKLIFLFEKNRNSINAEQ